MQNMYRNRTTANKIPDNIYVHIFSTVYNLLNKKNNSSHVNIPKQWDH